MAKLETKPATVELPFHNRNRVTVSESGSAAITVEYNPASGQRSTSGKTRILGTGSIVLADGAKMQYSIFAKD